MDVLSEVLRTVRLTGATFFNAEFRKPWGFTSPAMETLAPAFEPPRRHVVLYHLVIDGHAAVRLDHGPDVALDPGDVVVVPHGHAHRMWHGRALTWFDTAPAVRRALEGELSVTRAGGTGETTRFACGYFSCEPQAEHLFLAGLPPLMKVSLRDDGARSWIEDAIRFLSAEASSSHPGRLALLAKLSEALFVETLRRFMAALPEHDTGWLAGARDAVTGHALALLHRDPARRWTVEILARKVGTSRSTLEERFSHFLHEAPITYLAQWRLQLSARLLETTQRSVLEVAGDVGYESEAAFNRAFKRKFGQPPGRYRRTRSSMARRRIAGALAGIVLLTIGSVNAAPQQQTSRPRAGWPCGARLDPSYFQVTEGTGGHLLLLAPAEIADSASLLIAFGDHPHTLFRLAGELKPGVHEFHVPIDPSVESLLISISVQCLQTADVIGPSGVAVSGGDVTDLSNFNATRMVIVKSPAAGTWTIRTAGTGIGAVVVQARSALGIAHVEFAPVGSTEFRPVPSAGIENVVRITLTGGARRVEASVVNSAFRTIAQLRLEAGATDGVYVARFTPGAEGFRVTVTGTDAGDLPFQRVHAPLFTPLR